MRIKTLKVGETFFLSFSPERVDPGRKDWTTLNTPKVIGGITLDCTEVSATWYSQALQNVVPVSSAEVAEMAKLLENTFRMINIGLVNEMAIMCNRLGVDVWEVIDAAATKPFGFMKFTPGPGLGGHCIPIDPLYLSWKLRALNYTARFIELASEINTNMPRYVVQLVQDALNQQGKALNGSRVLVLGAAYKPDIDDLRESPALDVIGLLEKKSAQVSYHDPLIPHLHHDGWELTSVPDLMEAVNHSDCLVIITDHSSYDYTALLQAVDDGKGRLLIVDTRNAMKAASRSTPTFSGCKAHGKLPGHWHSRLHRFSRHPILLDAGHQVTGIDNLNSAYDVRVKEHRLRQILPRPGFTFHRIDISHRDSLESVLPEKPAIDAVINLAAHAGVRQSVEDPWVYVDTNLTGTLNLLELCQRRGIPKFILASTSSLYGANAPCLHPRLLTAATRCRHTPPRKRLLRYSAMSTTICTGWMSLSFAISLFTDRLDVQICPCFASPNGSAKDCRCA